MNTIGQNIKAFRKELGLTQEELASQLCVTAQAVSKWESDAGLPDTAQIVPLAKALNVTTDALFGVEMGNFDEAAARVADEIVRTNKNALDKRAGAFNGARLLLKECENNPLNFEVFMRFVQSISNLSQYVDYQGVSDEEVAEWEHFHEEGIRKGVQVIRYCKDSLVVEQTHFALAWIYIHDKEFDKAREHIAKLPSLKSNMLQESLLSEIACIQYGMDENIRVVRNNLQEFCRNLNKQLVYQAQTLMWNKVEVCEVFCKWALNIIAAFATDECMKPMCQGFVKDIYAYLITAQIKTGKIDEAAANYKKICATIMDYVEFCKKELERDDLADFYDERGRRNLSMYTLENAQHRIAELDCRLKDWNGADNEGYLKFIGRL